MRMHFRDFADMRVHKISSLKVATSVVGHGAGARTDARFTFHCGTIRRDEMELDANSRLGHGSRKAWRDDSPTLIQVWNPFSTVQGLQGAHGVNRMPRGYGSGQWRICECSCAYVRSSGQPDLGFLWRPKQAAPHGSDAPRRRTSPLRRGQRVHQGLISLDEGLLFDHVELLRTACGLRSNDEAA